MKNKMPSIYEPAEDSFLMAKTLKEQIPKLLNKNPNLKFLEVGCGSGINLETAEKAGVKINNIIGTDINPKAVANCKKLGFNCIQSDLFDRVKGNFDIIIFNPPYLPLDKEEPKSSRAETTGGKKGNEIIIKFLEQAREHLTQEGKIFIITSSLPPNINFSGLGYSSKEIDSKKLFFEKLFVWECLKI
jgi:release factor glutamine methyltransferase